MSTLDTLLASATATNKKETKPVLLLSPEMTQVAKSFVANTQAAESYETMATQEKDQLAALGSEYIREVCEKQGKVVSSIAFVGDGVSLTFTRDSRYCDIVPNDAINQLLKNVFGEDTSKYFTKDVEISIKKDKVQDEGLLQALSELFQDRFGEFFEAKVKLKVSSVFHTNYQTNPQFREKCTGLVQAGIVKPYAPTLKLK